MKRAVPDLGREQRDQIVVGRHLEAFGPGALDDDPRPDVRQPDGAERRNRPNLRPARSGTVDHRSLAVNRDAVGRALRFDTVVAGGEGEKNRNTRQVPRHDGQGYGSQGLSGSVETISMPKPASPTYVSLRAVSSRIEEMPRSFRICAPSPTSRQLRERATSEFGRIRLRDGVGRHAGGAVAQEHQHATALLLEALERGMHRVGAAEHVADDVGAMQPRRHVLAVADAAVHEGHVLDGVERRDVGVTGQRADRALDREFADPLDQLIARLPVGDDVGDRNLLELVAFGERRDRRPAHDGAVVVHQLGQHADRRQVGQPAQIDARFGVARPHQHAAVLGDQRKHVAGPHEIGGAAVAVGERAHGVGALFGRDAGGEAVAHVDRHGERGAERRVVGRHHRIETQPARLVGRQRRAHDAGRIADDERHLLGRAQRSRDEQVAFVLAVVVVGDDHDLARWRTPPAPRRRADEYRSLSCSLSCTPDALRLHPPPGAGRSTRRHHSCHVSGVRNGQAGVSPTCPR